MFCLWKKFCKQIWTGEPFNFGYGDVCYAPTNFSGLWENCLVVTSHYRASKTVSFYFQLISNMPQKVKGASLDIMLFVIYRKNHKHVLARLYLDQNSFISLIVEVRVRFGSITNYLFIRAKCIIFIIQVLINNFEWVIWLDMNALFCSTVCFILVHLYELITSWLSIIL